MQRLKFLTICSVVSLLFGECSNAMQIPYQQTNDNGQNSQNIDSMSSFQIDNSNSSQSFIESKNWMQRLCEIGVKDDNHLAIAILAKETDRVKSLVCQEQDINKEFGIFGTFLHLAAATGNEEIAKILVEKGANVDALNTNGESPLFNAILNGHTNMAELLIEHGADVNRENNTRGFTLLHLIAADGGMEMAEFLIRKGANVNAKSWSKNHPLIDSEKYETGELSPLLLATINTQKKMVEFLIERGADINIQNDDGDTPLHAMVKSGNIEMVEFLLRHDADTNIKNNNGDTPLLAADKLGNIEMVKLLQNGQ